MKTTPIVLLASLALIACENDDGPGSVDSGVNQVIDAMTGGGADAAQVADASPPPADAMPTTDADVGALGDLVEQIVDDLNDMYDFICDCNDLFCEDEESGTPFQIDATAKNCMMTAVLGKAGTPGLEGDLACAAKAIADATSCVKTEGCGDGEEVPFDTCFDDEPVCLDSPLFSDDFEDCLNF